MMPDVTDEQPAPDPMSFRLMGLADYYGPMRQTGIAPPRLTDDSLKGLYHATVGVPARAVRMLNAVSTRIGAPILTDGGVSTVVKQTYAAPPSVGALQRRTPAWIIDAWNRAGAWTRGQRDKFRVNPR